MSDNKKNIQSMTKPELLEYCKEKEIKVPSKATKNDIYLLIQEAEEKKAKQEKTKKTKNEKAPKAKKEDNKRTTPSRRKREEQARKEKTKRRKEREESVAKAVANEKNINTNYSPSSYSNVPDVHVVDDMPLDINPDYNSYDIDLALSKEDPTHYLKGTVGGVVDTGSYQRADGTIIKYGTVYINYGNRKVFIPSFQFFENWNDPILFSPDRWYQNLQNRMGSTVDFVVNIIENHGKDRVYYATRFPAMKKRRADRWYGKKRGTDNYYLDDGSITTARVVEAKEAGLVLEIEGAETFMPSKEIGHYYVPKANARYAAGDTVIVKISNVQRKKVPANTSNFKFPVTYSASIKDASKDPQEIYFSEFPEGSSHIGIVSNRIVDRQGRVRFYVNVGTDPDVVSVYCWLLEGVHKVPEIGDKVSIRVKGNDVSRYRIWGAIIHVFESNRSDKAFSIIEKEEG